MPGGVLPRCNSPAPRGAPSLVRGISRVALPLLLVHLTAPSDALSQATPRSAYEELQTFSGVLNHIRINYVDSVGYSHLVRAAINGVLRSLDPHSYFVSRQDMEQRTAIERGEIVGVGVALENVEATVTVLAVAPGSPAAKKGILPGDRIVAVDDTSTAGSEAHALEIRLAGKEGSKVRVTLERGPRIDPDSVTVTVKRDRFSISTVPIARMLDSTTGYVRLDEFAGRSPEEIEKAIDRLRGQRARQFVLDLRGNPGGVVTSSVEIASLFFPKNTLVFRTRGRKADVDEDFVTKRDGRFVEMPLVVLVDERSASAAEALAGSLQDHDRALIVGRRSFGKALMQTVFLLPWGDNVWLTVGRVMSPSGRFIQRQYQGLAVEQYRSLAGRSGAERDTVEVFKTKNGRPVRGGGGIVPDIAVPPRPALPVWWSAAADSGFDDAVSDSVAHTLSGEPSALSQWLTSSPEWERLLLPPFLERARVRLGVSVTLDSAVASRMARLLARRVAEVRWGREASEEFVLRNDADVAVALQQFTRIRTLLAPPSN